MDQKRGIGWAVFAAVVLSALPAHCDMTFGGSARTTAMGGAGLALTDNAQNTAINPAAEALHGQRGLSFPSINFESAGISLRQAYDRLKSGSIDQNGAVSLARNFGSNDSELGVGGDVGIGLGGARVGVSGIARVRLQPNAALQTWANTANGDISKLSGAEQADLLGATVYTLPAIDLSHNFNGNCVGLRLKPMRALFTHYVVNAANIANSTNATLAPEMGTNKTLSKNGFGVDLGLLTVPKDQQGFSVAAVITNFITPSLNFDGTDRFGKAKRYGLEPRSLSLGTAYQQNGATLAFDIVDVSRAYGNAEVRLGAEQKSGPLALRVGWAQGHGISYGFGLGGFGLAFGKHAPVEVIQTLRF